MKYLMLLLLFVGCAPTSQQLVDRTLQKHPNLAHRVTVILSQDLRIHIGGVRGMYDPATRTITVADTPDRLESWLIHELGHAHWYLVLTKEQREVWMQDWVDRTDAGGPWPSDYAATNPSEFYAESFRLEHEG